jgi:hypothetical protein
MKERSPVTALLAVTRRPMERLFHRPFGPEANLTGTTET